MPEPAASTRRACRALRRPPAAGRARAARRCVRSRARSARRPGARGPATAPRAPARSRGGIELLGVEHVQQKQLGAELAGECDAIVDRGARRLAEIGRYQNSIQGEHRAPGSLMSSELPYAWASFAVHRRRGECCRPRGRATIRAMSTRDRGRQIRGAGLATAAAALADEHGRSRRTIRSVPSTTARASRVSKASSPNSSS